MPITVTIVAYDAPEEPVTTRVMDGDYLIVTVDPCREDSIQVYKNGATHVITIKDRTIR